MSPTSLTACPFFPGLIQGLQRSHIGYMRPLWGRVRVPLTALLEICDVSDITYALSLCSGFQEGPQRGPISIKD